jgi:hypothetical protein
MVAVSALDTNVDWLRIAISMPAPVVVHLARVEGPEWPDPSIICRHADNDWTIA